MKNLFVPQQKLQIVHHEVNRACTRVRYSVPHSVPSPSTVFWMVVARTDGGGDLRSDTFYCRPIVAWD